MVFPYMYCILSRPHFLLVVSDCSRLLGDSFVAVLVFRWVGNVWKTSEVLVKCTIPAFLPTLTGSRGKYLRVVGIIRSDG